MSVVCHVFTNREIAKCERQRFKEGAVFSQTNISGISLSTVSVSNNTLQAMHVSSMHMTVMSVISV